MTYGMRIGWKKGQPEFYGTIGGFASNLEDQTAVYLLTCGHVVRNTVGQRIYVFPKGATEGTYIGDVTKTTPSGNNDANNPKLLDAALVRIENPSLWKIDYKFNGTALHGTEDAKLGQEVTMIGAKSGKTELLVIEVTDYRTSGYSVKNLVHPGDSGSLVISREMPPTAVGLVYAGTPEGLVYSCNIDRIFTFFSGFRLKISPTSLAIG